MKRLLTIATLFILVLFSMAAVWHRVAPRPADAQAGITAPPVPSVPPATQVTPSPPPAQKAVQTPGPSAPVSSPRQMRGVIEGFYGQPWSEQERLDLFHFMAQHHFNTYVYAPKDDPYQRQAWGALYPAALHRSMGALVQGAKADGIRFVYSISPGIPTPLSGHRLATGAVQQSITFTSIRDRQRLLAKIDQMRAMGVHTFMLSFDDAEPFLKAQDQKAYGNDYARADVDLADFIWRTERQKDPSFQLWLAPTTYYGVTDNPYWRTIRRHLNVHIGVVWTGKWVLNQTITTAQAAEVRRLLGRKPILWDNYPVNDYTYVVQKTPALFMAPIQGRSPTLMTELSGYMANPMIQPYASEIPLAAIGDYLNDPRSYHSGGELSAVMARLPGIGNREAFDLFCTFTGLDGKNAVFANDASTFFRTRGTLEAASSEAALRAQLTAIARVPDELKRTLANRQLDQEIQPWADKLGMEGTVGLQALGYLDMASSDPGRAAKQKAIAAELAQLKSNRYRVGGQIIQFIQAAITQTGG